MEKRVLTTSTLIGNNVKNLDGEDVGTIEELVIDPGSGRIVSAVLSPNDQERHGDRSTVPWDALTLSSFDGSFYLSGPKALHSAPATRHTDPRAAQGSKEVIIYTSSVFRSSEER